MLAIISTPDCLPVDRIARVGQTSVPVRAERTVAGARLMLQGADVAVEVRIPLLCHLALLHCIRGYLAPRLLVQRKLSSDGQPGEEVRSSMPTRMKSLPDHPCDDAWEPAQGLTAHHKDLNEQPTHRRRATFAQG